MDKQNKANLVYTATYTIWENFEWLKNNCLTEYVTGEFPINDRYSIYAYEETDSIDKEDKWINISIEKYNKQGRCVNEYVVTYATRSFTKWALWCGINRVINKFSSKFDLDLLAKDGG